MFDDIGSSMLLSKEMSDKPKPQVKEITKIHVCECCYFVTESFHKQCPDCGQKVMRSCHTKHCLNIVNGNIGTTCDDCKSRNNSDE